jgi:hypothetical protein
MQSANSSELLELDLDLPTTWEDVAAQRRAKNCQQLSLSAYLDFLANLPQVSLAELRRRKHPDGIKRFEL